MLLKGHYYNYYCCDNLWKSKFMAQEKHEKLVEFFSFTVSDHAEHYRVGFRRTETSVCA